MMDFEAADVLLVQGTRLKLPHEARSADSDVVAGEELRSRRWCRRQKPGCCLVFVGIQYPSSGDLGKLEKMP